MQSRHIGGYSYGEKEKKYGLMERDLKAKDAK